MLNYNGKVIKVRLTLLLFVINSNAGQSNKQCLNWQNGHHLAEDVAQLRDEKMNNY